MKKFSGPEPNPEIEGFEETLHFAIEGLSQEKRKWIIKEFQRLARSILLQRLWLSIYRGWARSDHARVVRFLDELEDLIKSWRKNTIGSGPGICGKTEEAYFRCANAIDNLVKESFGKRKQQ